MGMRHIFICGQLHTIIFFHFISHTAGFSKKKMNTNVCFDFLYKFFWNISHFMQKLASYAKTLYRSSRKVPISLVRFKCYLNFLDRFSINPVISKFIKSVQWEPNCSTLTEGQTDRHDEANSHFSQFLRTRRETSTKVEASWNVAAHAQKPSFVFRRNGLVHLNHWVLQFSRLLAAELCASAVVILDTPCSEVVWRVLATHSIRQFPLHVLSRASECAIISQLESTTRTKHDRKKNVWRQTSVLANQLTESHPANLSAVDTLTNACCS